MKRKTAMLAILSLLLMILPAGGAFAAETPGASYDRIAQIQQNCSGTSPYVYSRCPDMLQGTDIRGMNLDQIRSLLLRMCGSACAPAATPRATTAPTPKPTVVPTPVPSKPTAVPTPVPTPKPAATPTPAPSNGSMSALERQMIDLVNADRAANGLPALRFDAGLRAGALKHSQDMSAGNYFSHTSPMYGGFSGRIKASGVSYQSAGENIALYNNVEKAQAALMNSEGHRANILSPSFTRVGIGIVWNQSKGAYYITQWFAR